jgi:hypothetical protein
MCSFHEFRVKKRSEKYVLVDHKIGEHPEDSVPALGDRNWIGGGNGQTPAFFTLPAPSHSHEHILFLMAAFSASALFPPNGMCDQKKATCRFFSFLISIRPLCQLVAFVSYFCGVIFLDNCCSSIEMCLLVIFPFPIFGLAKTIHVSHMLPLCFNGV